jgi:hypothetical protein
MVDTYRQTMAPRVAALAGLPEWVGALYIKFMMRPSVIKMLNGQGHGDLTDAQYHAEWLNDLRVIEHFLATSASGFALGSRAEPTRYDAIAYAWLKLTRLPDVPEATTAHGAAGAVTLARTSPAITAYVERVEKAMSAKDAKKKKAN